MKWRAAHRAAGELRGRRAALAPAPHPISAVSSAGRQKPLTPRSSNFCSRLFLLLCTVKVTFCPAGRGGGGAAGCQGCGVRWALEAGPCP